MANKTVLIVGASGSVGKACKVKAEQNNYTVLTTSSNKSKQNNTDWFWIDFNNPTSIDELQIEHQIDMVIICAGKEPQKNLLETNWQHLNEMNNIHVLGPILLLQKIVNKINEGGSIVLLSSPAALKGSYDPIYAAVKGAVNSLVKTLAKDLGPRIRVNAVSPSLIINSPVYERMTPDFREKHLNNTYTKQNTTSQQCAEAIFFMGEHKQITGQVLQVNGGMV
jgi:3-oxoacyl-[acyl-carrier protein] reductase